MTPALAVRLEQKHNARAELARALEMFNAGMPYDYPAICMFREALREYFTADAELDGLVSKAVGS
jgi:hypothetical protein